MKAGKSFKIYPRPDHEYEHKTSLDFDLNKCNLYAKRPTGDGVQGYLWVGCFLVGFLMGSIAFLMDLLVDFLSTLKWKVTQLVLLESVPLACVVYIVFCGIFMGIAATISVYIAPAAIGSGVAEAMGFMNGIRYPHYIGIKTLFVKIFGLCFAVAAGMCSGKEGPLVHIGAIVG